MVNTATVRASESGDSPSAYRKRVEKLKQEGDFARMETLVLEGLEKFPDQVWFYVEYGLLAMRRKDWGEADRRWTLLRKKFPDHPRGYKDGAAALKEFGKFAAADALALEGMQRLPNNPWLYVEYANIATCRQNWEEAGRRWALLRQQHPQNLRGHIGKAAVLKASGNFAEAEALVLAGMAAFPEEPGWRAEYGDIAMRQMDWEEAGERWALMREKFPDQPRGYKDGAAALKELGNFVAAEALVLEGIQRCPDPLWLYVEYGDIAMRRKEWTEATRRWTLMREHCPDHPRIYVGEVAVLREQGDFAGAEARVLEGLDKFPFYPGLAVEYGLIAMRQRDWAEAAQRWTLMREKFPDQPRGYRDGAAALKELGDFAGAEALVLEGLRRFPRHSWLYVEYSDIAMRQKDWAEAEKRWALLREHCPEHARIAVGEAAVLKELGDFASAETLLLEEMRKFPDEPRLYAEYGNIALRQKDWVEADKRWTLMREKFPRHPRGYVGGVTALREQGDLAGADTLVLEGLRTFPEELGLLIEYGQIAMCRKDWAEADERWALLREKFPNHPRGYVGEVAVLKELDDLIGAEALVLAGMQRFPEDPGLCVEYGDIAMRQKNWAEAGERWTQMREKFPDHPRGYVGGAAVLREQGAFAEAESLVLEGLRKFPEALGLFLEYGHIATRRKDWMEACKRWAMLREKFPDHPRGYGAGAIALKEQGDFAGAKALLCQGLQRFPLDQSLQTEYSNLGRGFLDSLKQDPVRQTPLWQKWLERQSQETDEAFWQTNAARPSVEELADFLGGYEVISFDIFDTALFRTVDLPQDIFTIMAAEMRFSDFLSVRRRAENRARGKKQRTLNTREVVLDEIWAVLEAEYGIDPRWKAREIELELTHSVVNPYIKEVYDRMLAAGKTLVFMSDMYLPREIVERLLNQAGYLGYDKIFLSNERGCSKGEGTLQRVMQESYQGKKIIHIGDNFRADVEKTRKVGMDALHTIDQRRIKSVYECGKANLGSSFYRALINNTMNNGIPLNMGKYYEHGFRIGGILAAGYCQFINETAHKHQCDTIVFCARDCQVLHRIYNTYYHEFDNVYAAISRNAILGVTKKRYYHDYIGRSVMRQIDKQKYRATLAEIFKDTGFEYLVDKLELYDIEKYLFPQSIMRIEKIEEFLYAEQETVLRHKKKNVDGARKYFSSLLGNAKNILIVDIGWTGTCISALKYFCETELSDLDLVVHGVVLCTSRNEALTTSIMDEDIEAYIYSPYKNMDLTRRFMEGKKMTVEQRDLVHMPLEYLFTSEEASLIDYDLDERGEVLLKRTALPPPNADEIQAIQDGMFDFCGAFQNATASCRIPVAISPYLACGPLWEAIRQPEYCREIYGNFHYDANSSLFEDSDKRIMFRTLFDHIHEKPEKSPQTVERNKRILFVSPEMIYAGALKSLLRIVRVTKEAGYDLEVWTAKSGPFMQEFANLDIPVFVVGENDLWKDDIIQRISSFDAALCNTIVTDAYVRTLGRQIPVAWYIREATNISDFCIGVPQRLETLRTSQGIVCVSDYAAQAIRKFTDMPIQVVHNAVEDEASMALPHRFLKNGKIRFIQMGFIEYRKGYDLFISAYKSLPAAYKRLVEIWFAGGFINSGTSFCSYIFNAIKGEDNIHFLGQIRDNRKKIAIMSQMDAVVVASRDESCSLVALEGAMLSKPLIVTENVGARYMVDGQNGLVIKADSVAALRAAFMDFVDRSGRLESMGRASRRLYEEKASMAAHRRDIVALLEKTIQRKPCAEQGKPTKRPLAVRLPKKRLLVSLTSHPPRIRTTAQAVASLLRQTRPADRVVLWLSRDQFPAGNAELPADLLRLTKYGLEIAWRDGDLKPHTKYWYIMQEEPDALVVCVDDDVTYHERLVETLYRCHLDHPHAVVCTRANLMLFRPDGSFRSYDNWIYDYRARRNTLSYRLLPTGVGGVLYPPHAVPQAAFDQTAVTATCLHCDDLWLKIMTTLNGYPGVLTPTSYNLPTIEGTQQSADGALWIVNTVLGGNDEALAAILNYVEKKYGFRDRLMKRLWGIGDEGEWCVRISD